MTAPTGSPPRLAAVLGAPVAHSLSPLIHRIWAEREGVNAHYIPVDTGGKPEGFARAVEALRTLGFSGCNVTLPHKEQALAIADRATEEAKAAGAANMLTFAAGGVLADNSDSEGFAESVRSLGPRKRALVLGAGGAARAVARALKSSGAAVAVANRTDARARALADVMDAQVVPWAERGALGDFDLLVNATSLGMKGAAALDVDLARLPRGAAVVDIVYAPLETPLLVAARARGLVAVDGLGMLMHQAAKGYRAWLGARAEVDEALRRMLEAELARRG